MLSRGPQASCAIITIYARLAAGHPANKPLNAESVKFRERYKNIEPDFHIAIMPMSMIDNMFSQKKIVALK